MKKKENKRMVRAFSLLNSLLLSFFLFFLQACMRAYLGCVDRDVKVMQRGDGSVGLGLLLVASRAGEQAWRIASDPELSCRGNKKGTSQAPPAFSFLLRTSATKQVEWSGPSFLNSKVNERRSRWQKLLRIILGSMAASLLRAEEA
jgi:hypothetical protein